MTRLLLPVVLVLAGCPHVLDTSDAGGDAYAHDAGPPEANGLDVLFMIDNSGSMAEEQTNFIVELPRLFRAITSGDVDGDGAPDMRPVTSLHVGIITSDMGAGPNTGVPTCARGNGDDGILRERSRLRTAPCMDTYPSGLFEFGASDSVGDFSTTLGCVANIGTGGCGFEQQLEAALKAVTPVTASAWTGEGYVPPRFVSPDGVVDSIAGSADGPNTGFVRSDSALAILILTDEEDCSVRDYGLFVTADPRFMSVPLQLRCNTFGEGSGLGVVQPVLRYVDGFIGLRRDPRLLAFSVIAGIPPDTESAAAAHDYASVLSNENMVPRPTAMGTNLEPSCSTANGVAYPPIRMVQTAAGLHARGAQVSLSSICSTSFEPAMDRFLGTLAPTFPR